MSLSDRIPIDRRQSQTLVIVALVLMSVGVGSLIVYAVAPFLSNSVHVQNGVTLHAPSGPAVNITETADVNMTNMYPASDTVEIRSSAGNITVNGSQFANVTITNINGTWTNTTDIDVIGKTVTLDPDDKAAVTLGGDITAFEWRSGMALDDGTADFTYSSSIGSGSVTLNGLPGNTQVGAVDRSTNTLLDVDSTDGSGSVTFSGLDSGSQTVHLVTSKGGPNAVDASASPDGGVSTDMPTLEIDVEDPDFPTADTVTVEWYVDGSNVNTETITSNQTVTHTTSQLGGGDHTWHVELEDGYGQTDTSNTFNANIPQNLTIREETSPYDIITGSNVTVKFFEQTDDDPTIIERSDENGDGNISLTGLPVGESFAVTAKAPGYHNRTLIITSLFDQQSAFLLNQSRTSVENVFGIEDLTGEYQADDDVELRIQKTVNRSVYDSGGWQWTNIAGDRVGSTIPLTATLEFEDRYRIIVTNADGDRRVLGEHTPKNAGAITLTIGQVRIRPDETEQWYARSWIETTDNDAKIFHFHFNDTTDETTDLNLKVYNRSDESDVLVDNNGNGWTDQVAGPLGSYTFTQNLTALAGNQDETDWIVFWNATRNGETISATTQAGSVERELPLPEELMYTASFVGIVIFAALWPDRIAHIGGLAVVALAGALILLGWTNIPTAAWWVAAAIAVFGYVARVQNPTYQ